jgi:hypothetical protein
MAVLRLPFIAEKLKVRLKANQETGLIKKENRKAKKHIYRPTCSSPDPPQVSILLLKTTQRQLYTSGLSGKLTAPK